MGLKCIVVIRSWIIAYYIERCVQPRLVASVFVSDSRDNTTPNKYKGLGGLWKFVCVLVVDVQTGINDQKYWPMGIELSNFYVGNA